MIRGVLIKTGLIVSVALFGLGLFGLFYTPDLRTRFDEPLLSYDEALARIARSYETHGPSQAFLAESAAVYDEATAYEWPDGLARVSILDNWILFAAAWLDPVLTATGLKNDGTAFFSQYETYDYKRALGRGFGICSQNAQGYADLLHREYGLTTRLVGLDGHVVTQVELPPAAFLADPSAGILLPFGLSEAPDHLPEISRAYQTRGSGPDLSETYDAAGNVLGAAVGSGAYAAPQWRQMAVKRLEQASEYAMVLLPLAGIIVFLWLDRRPRRRR